MSAEAVAALESLLARVQARAAEPRPVQRAAERWVGDTAAPGPSAGASAAPEAAVAPRTATVGAPSQRVALPGPDPVHMDEPFGTESIKAPPSPELQVGGAGELTSQRNQGVSSYEGQRPTPVAPSVSLADDDIEEYDDELIEVIEDSEPMGAPAPPDLAAASAVPPAGPPPRKDTAPHLVVAPSAGAPSLERHAPVAPSDPSMARPQVVARAVVSPGSEVVRAEGQLASGRPETFLALLDDSLAL